MSKNLNQRFALNDSNQNDNKNKKITEYKKQLVEQADNRTRATQNLSYNNISNVCQMCRLLRQQLQKEIFQLKDKAHQSFMQVIQIQQLHDEEIEMLKQQYELEINQLKMHIDQIESAHLKMKDRVYLLQKNSKYHACEIDQPSLLIQNIDIIKCNSEDQDENKKDEVEQDNFMNKSILNQSSIAQLTKQMIEGGQNNSNKFISEGYLFREKKSEINSQFISQLNEQINQFTAENANLLIVNQELKKQVESIASKYETVKNNYDSLEKQCKFMSDHIRNLSSDKFRLQKRVKQLQKDIKETKKIIQQKGQKQQQKRGKSIGDYFNPPNINQNSLKIKISNVWGNKNISNSYNDLSTFMNLQKQKQNQNNRSINLTSRSNATQQDFFTCIQKEQKQSVTSKKQHQNSNILSSVASSLINFEQEYFYKPTVNNMNKIKQELIETDSPRKGVLGRKSLPNYKLVGNNMSSIIKKQPHGQKFSPLANKKKKQDNLTNKTKIDSSRISNSCNFGCVDESMNQTSSLIKQIHDELLSKQKHAFMKKSITQVSKLFRSRGPEEEALIDFQCEQLIGKKLFNASRNKQKNTIIQ